MFVAITWLGENRWIRDEKADASRIERLTIEEDRNQTINKLSSFAVNQDWYCNVLGTSRNGQWVGIFAVPNHGGADTLPRESYKGWYDFGVLDVKTNTAQWIPIRQEHTPCSVRKLAVTNDGQYMALPGMDAGIWMADFKDKKIAWKQRPEHEPSFHYAEFSPDDKIVYTGGLGGWVCAYETQTGKLLDSWPAAMGDDDDDMDAPITAIAVSPDGRFVAAGAGIGGYVYVWDVKASKLQQVFHHGLSSILAVAFSPESNRVASMGGGSIMTWQLTGVVGTTPATQPATSPATQATSKPK